MKRLIIIALLAIVAGTAGAREKRLGAKDVPQIVTEAKQKANPQGMAWDPDQAYVLLCRADSILKKCSKPELRRLERQRVTPKDVRITLQKLYKDALDEAEQANEPEALTHYIDTYKRAPRYLKKDAMARRDWLKQWSPRVEKLSYTEPKKPKMSSWAAVHQMCTESGFVEDLSYFSKAFGYKGHPDVKQHDDSVRAAWLQASKGEISRETFIRIAAPYRMAYNTLVKELKPLIDQRAFAAAFASAKRYADAFGDDPSYNDLLRVLSQPDDSIPAVELLPPTVNSPGREYAAIITVDGQTIYFCGRNRPGCLRPQWEDLFVTRRLADGWSEAELVEELSEADNHDAVENISADGQTMMVFKGGTCCISRKTRRGWGKPEPVEWLNRFADWISDVQLAADGKTMLFAAKTTLPYQLRENINIYVSERKANGKWGAPKPLGPAINSQNHDRSPILHPDGRTLYFTSCGHGTMGDFDIFRSTRLNMNSWDEWSEPENIGHVANTTGSEEWIQVTADGTTGLITTGEYYHEDLALFTLPEALRPNAIATIRGTLRSDSGEPIGATIRWEEKESGREVGQAQSDPEDGTFLIMMPYGGTYRFYVMDDEHFSLSKELDLSDTTKTTFELEGLKVVSVKEFVNGDNTISVRDLNFATGSDQLQPAAKRELKRIATFVSRLQRSVEVGGHADTTGSEETNEALSLRRAEAVRAELVANGCKAEQLIIKGYGSTRPVADNSTAEGRQQNRRVELKIK